MLDEIILRLKALVPAFGGRVEGALQLARLQSQNALPQVTPAAFVVPAGLRGGSADTISGLFRQSTTETFSVIFVMRSENARGGDALDPLSALRGTIIAALAGWDLGDAVDVLTLSAAYVVSMTDGAVIYQIDFTLQDQLRIST